VFWLHDKLIKTISIAFFFNESQFMKLIFVKSGLCLKSVFAPANFEFVIMFYEGVRLQVVWFCFKCVKCEFLGSSSCLFVDLIVKNELGRS